MPPSPVGRLRPLSRNCWPAKGAGCQGQERRLLPSLGFFLVSTVSRPHRSPLLASRPAFLSFGFCCQSQARADREPGLGAPSWRPRLGGELEM